MTDREMIEEMASIICKETSNRGLCEKCGFKRQERFGYVYQCYHFDNAEALYNAGYRQINEYNEVASLTLDRVRKETAEKIWNRAKHDFIGLDEISLKVLKSIIKNDIGVEIKE